MLTPVQGKPETRMVRTAITGMGAGWWLRFNETKPDKTPQLLRSAQTRFYPLALVEAAG
jgi:hypothetical protein